LTIHHPALGSRPTGERIGDAPTNTDSGVAALAATLMDELADAFAVMDWAEDEIARAIRRHPDHADALYHSFGLIRPRDIGPGMGSEFVFRSHAAELLDRIAASADTRPATAAELCLVCCEASLRTPLHGPTAGVYFRMWLRAFPDRPITPGQADEQVTTRSSTAPRSTTWNEPCARRPPIPAVSSAASTAPASTTAHPSHAGMRPRHRSPHRPSSPSTQPILLSWKPAAKRPPTMRAVAHGWRLGCASACSSTNGLPRTRVVVGALVDDGEGGFGGERFWAALNRAGSKRSTDASAPATQLAFRSCVVGLDPGSVG
jgi:hypothetical protein